MQLYTAITTVGVMTRSFKTLGLSEETLDVEEDMEKTEET